MKTALRTTALTLATLMIPAGIALTPALHAQSAPAFRTLTGKVTDKGGAPVKGAVVHLKDTKSLSQRSYITAEDGSYKFAQLSTSTDFEVWADSAGTRTDSKSLSSFDNKTAASIDLKLPN